MQCTIFPIVINKTWTGSVRPQHSVWWRLSGCCFSFVKSIKPTKSDYSLITGTVLQTRDAAPPSGPYKIMQLDTVNSRMTDLYDWTEKQECKATKISHEPTVWKQWPLCNTSNNTSTVWGKRGNFASDLVQIKNRKCKSNKCHMMPLCCLIGSCVPMSDYL